MDLYDFLASYGIIGLSISTALGISFNNIMESISAEIVLPLLGALFGIKNFKDLHMIILNQDVNIGRIIQSILSYITILTIIFVLSYFFFYKLIIKINELKKKHEQQLLEEQSKTVGLLQDIKELEKEREGRIYGYSGHQYI